MARLVKGKGPIAGVCAGLSKKYGIDVTIVRVLFVVFSLFFFGTGVLIYLILAIVMPSASLAIQDGGGQMNKGGVQEGVVYCRSCGHSNTDKAKFCKKCGDSLTQ